MFVKFHVASPDLNHKVPLRQNQPDPSDVWRYASRMETFGRMYEQFRVQGMELAGKLRELIHEANVRRIIIKDEHGHTFMEIPLTVATIGFVAAPILAAAGAIATVVARFEIVVERAAPSSPAASEGAPATGPGVGATQDNVNAETVNKQDAASPGSRDSLGG